MAYYASYKVPKSVKLIPELFRDAGYYVTNKSKTDYNFIPTSNLYHGSDWKKAPANQPIFAQFQLKGGKNRKAKSHADPNKVVLPPYYPDHPALRRDWAKYLDSWVETDKEVGRILTDLEKAGRLDSTAVFLWTDHGVSHLRGKQFLYEEGIHVPLVIRLPAKKLAGTVRDDLIEHIDVAACSLKLAGIKIPDNVQGRDFLAPDYKPREFIFAGRDRCDETVDILRCVRDSRYKYVRNFMSHVPHAQPSQYKDGKKIGKKGYEMPPKDTGYAREDIDKDYAAALAEQAESEPTPALSVADELRKLKELLDEGVLTPEEFESQKQKLLGD